MTILFFFIFVAIIISYIDIKNSIIPDKIIVPAIAVLLVIKFFSHTLSLNDFIGAGIVLIVFILPILFNMNFGGGDLRFGVFCALFLGLPLIGWFVLLSGVLHLLVLLILKKDSFGFAPAMSAATLGSYLVGKI